jgi:hypothetical protein
VHTRRARERAAKAEVSPVAQESVVRARDRSDEPAEAPAKRSSPPPVPKPVAEAVLLSANDPHAKRRSSRPPAPLGAPPHQPHVSSLPPPPRAVETSSKLWIWFVLGLLIIGGLAFALTAVLIR